MATEEELRAHFDAFLDALGAGDMEAALQAFRAYDYPRQEAWWKREKAAATGLAPDAEIVNRTQFGDWASEYRGADGLFALMDEIEMNTRSSHLEAEEIRSEGDRAAVLGTLHVVARHTGMEFDLPWANVFTISEREITRMEMFTDHDAALAALREGDRGQR